MNFNDAMAKALEVTPPEQIPKGDPSYPKLLAFLWSMIALSKNKLDDIAYIDNNNNIISIPLQKSTEKSTAKKSKAAKAKATDKPAVADAKAGENIVDKNGGKESTAESN